MKKAVSIKENFFEEEMKINAIVPNGTIGDGLFYGEIYTQVGFRTLQGYIRSGWLAKVPVDTIKAIKAALSREQEGQELDIYSDVLLKGFRKQIWNKASSQIFFDIEDAHPLIRYLINARQHGMVGDIPLEAIVLGFNESFFSIDMSPLTAKQVKEVLEKQVETFHLENDILFTDGVYVSGRLCSRFYTVCKEDEEC